jgi:23S rRNA pseudouridine1911/1915/1917 synthase
MHYSHIIKFHEANQRLDHFVAKHAALSEQGALSRAECSQAIKKGFVLVNNEPSKPSLVLKTGDTVAYTQELHKKPLLLVANAKLTLTRIFENEHMLILDKPAGIAMHPASTKDTGTVVNWLLAHYPAIAHIGEDPLRPGIVHRLDKDTTGICVIAKTQDAFTALKLLFKNREIHKTYIGLAHGVILPPEGKIDGSIGRSLRLHKQVVVDKKLIVKGKIRNALTIYTVTENIQSYSLVELRPQTGRMHQIRVHLSSIGHPLVGDMLYGNKISKKVDQELSLTAERHLLHAHKLEFNLFDKEYSFTSPLPDDFQRYIDFLKSHGAQEKASDVD